MKHFNSNINKATSVFPSKQQMRVKDPSRTNPEKPKRSKRPNRPQDEDSSDDISGKYIRWCLSWGWGLVTSMLSDENQKSWYHDILFLLKFVTEISPVECLWHDQLLHYMTALKGWRAGWSSMTASSKQNGPFFSMKRQARVAGGCLAEQGASSWVQRGKGRAERVEAGLGCPCRGLERAVLGIR